MYKIYADGSIIFDDVSPVDALKLIEPKLTLEDNSAGSLSFKVPPVNVGYNSINCMTTELVVTRDNEEIWRGRPIQEDIDFWKCKKYMCEGELAYLNDTIQLPRKYNVSNTTVATFLTSLIDYHNSQVGNASNKRFSIDNNAITVDDGDTLDDSDAINRFTNYETTLKCINEKLVDRLGGHLRIRHIGNTRYLDYLKDYSEIGASDQVIRFGSNLLDYASNLDSINWVTAIVPKGKRLEIEEEDQPVPGLEAYTNVSSINTADGTWHEAGSFYVTNKTLVDQYGYICAVVEWSEVTDPSILLSKAKKYLQDNLFDQLCLEISAVDLHYLNPSIETLKVQETVRCISEPHGMDATFPVTKVELDLVNPSNTKYTLGTKVSATLTEAQNRANSSLAQYVDDTFIPTESLVLSNAQNTATGLINGAAPEGYANWLYGLDANGNADLNQTAANPKTPTGLRVGNTDKDSTSTSRWLWTTGGLGHWKRNSTSVLWKNVSVNVALTADGAIVADRITTGCIKLTGAANVNTWDTTGASSASLKAFLQTYDANGNLIGRWGTEGIWIGKGSIRLGSKGSAVSYKNASGSYQTGYYPVEINNDGSALFRYATITTGSTIGKSTIDANGVIGNFGTVSTMAGMRIGDGTFGISSDKASGNSGSWGGLCFGAEAYDKRGFGNMSCILFDGSEESAGYQQGGFFVIHGSPNERGSNYTKQTFNTFTIVRNGSGVATFDEDFYNKVITLWNER